MPKLELDVSVFGLSLSAEGRDLTTNRGSLSLGADLTIDTASGQDPKSLELFARDWVMQGGNRILWLPPDCRRATMACHRNTFALGYESGGVAFIRFTFS